MPPSLRRTTGAPVTVTSSLMSSAMVTMWAVVTIPLPGKACTRVTVGAVVGRLEIDFEKILVDLRYEFC